MSARGDRRWTRTIAALAGLVVVAFALPVRVGDPPPVTIPGECEALDPAVDGPAALERYERCAAAQPGTAALEGALGRLYEAAGRTAQAEAAYRRALAVTPADADIRLRVARILLARHEREAAIREAQAVLVTHPNHEAALEFIRMAVASGSQ